MKERMKEMKEELQKKIKCNEEIIQMFLEDIKRMSDRSLEEMEQGHVRSAISYAESIGSRTKDIESIENDIRSCLSQIRLIECMEKEEA